MKIVFLMVCVFLIAMITSVLLDWDFVEYNPVRYVLVVMLIILELVTGFYYVKAEIKKLK
jgi:hypothetical protein